MMHSKVFMKTKCPFSNGSNDWKGWMSRALQYAVNTQMWRHMQTDGREGIHPGWEYTIVFEGLPPFTKAYVDFHTVPGLSWRQAKDSSAINRHDAADIFAGSGDVPEATL